MRQLPVIPLPTLFLVAFACHAGTMGSSDECQAFDSVFPQEEEVVVVSTSDHLLGSISDIEAMPDGKLLIADAMEADIKLYAADGHWLRSFGGLGDGPGEFRRPTALALIPGGFAALDEQHRLVTRFSWSGQYLGADVLQLSQPYGLEYMSGHFVLAGRGASSGPRTNRGVVHVVRIGGDVDRSFGIEAKPQHLYEANFSGPVFATLGTMAVVGRRASNIVQLVDLSTGTVSSLLLATRWYRPPDWPKSRFGTASGLRELTDWGNQQSWLLGLWLINPRWILSRFSGGGVGATKAFYVLAPLLRLDSAIPICPTETTVAAVSATGTVWTYAAIADTTRITARYARLRF